MNQLVVRFQDFPNSERSIKGSLSTVKGYKVERAINDQRFRPVRYGRSVGYIHNWATVQGMVLVEFAEKSRGVYEARYLSKEEAREEAILMAHLREREQQLADNPDLHRASYPNYKRVVASSPKPRVYGA